jgi:hypothetical protein
VEAMVTVALELFYTMTLLMIDGMKGREWMTASASGDEAREAKRHKLITRRSGHVRQRVGDNQLGGRER